MRLIRSTLGLVAGLLVGLGGLACLGGASAAFAADYKVQYWGPTKNPGPIASGYTFGVASPVGAASSAYLTECYGRSQQKTGNLSLKKIDEIDPIRCFRGVTGDFNMTAQEPWNAIPFLVLPWVEWVGGDLDIEGQGAANFFDEVRLSRLWRVDGKLILDYNPAFEGLTTPDLTTTGEVTVKMRSMDLDLTGMDALEEISGKLRFESTHEDSPPTFRGMAGLTTVGSYSTEGFGVIDVMQGPGLENLRVVKGNVSIDIAEHNNPPAGYRAVYGTQAIETICGNLSISGDVAAFSAGGDFPLLSHVKGAIWIDGANGSNQFPNVTTGGSPADCQ